mmetsp:Transcript_26634/g.57980  ORF Transcript_26634/g.57980 Transcript_26634/m.57980 type:complete len:210 (+) Transcript_26634:234-863(+)
MTICSAPRKAHSRRLSSKGRHTVIRSRCPPESKWVRPKGHERPGPKVSGQTIYRSSMHISIASMHDLEGSLSPAGSLGPSEMLMILISPSSTYIEKRLQRRLPSTSMGPGWSITTPSALVSSHRVSARKVMLEPSIFWSLAQAVMTAPSFTQYTNTSSIPAALRASWPLRYPGTWHVDHVGVNAPGRPTTMVFLPFRRSGMFTFSGGKP